MKRIYLFILFFACNYIQAQTSKEEIFNNIEKSAGTYFAYPEKEIKRQTPAPVGYVPFYISHLGRHGSRYMSREESYKDMADLFEKAAKNNVLTKLGADVHKKLQLLWQEVQWRGGDLSARGVKEQRGIAERIYRNYPQVFTDKGSFTARATVVVRCILSMDAFCERLKELNPQLSIDRNSGMKWQRYLDHETRKAVEYRTADATKAGYEQFEKEHVHPDRLIKSLFTDIEFFDKKTHPETVMWALYSIAVGMQNIDTNVSFYDIFSKQELFDLWQCKNYHWYVNYANSALNDGIMMDNAKPLLKNIIESAEAIISNNGSGADFRFAHDGNLVPLAMLMHLEGCYASIVNPSAFYTVWSNFKVAPMAGNIQMIFFKKRGSKDILVKFLHNENEVLIPPVKSDMLPYYHWQDIASYYKSLF